MLAFGRPRPLLGNSGLRECFRGEIESERLAALGLCLFAGRDDSDADSRKSMVSSTKGLGMLVRMKQHMDGYHVKPGRALRLSML